MVPFIIAFIEFIWLAMNDCRKASITGIPPPTLASNPIRQLFSEAILKRSHPNFAITSLLAVTMCLPLFSAILM